MCLSKVKHFVSCQNSMLQLIVVTALLVATVKCGVKPGVYNPSAGRAYGEDTHNGFSLMEEGIGYGKTGRNFELPDEGVGVRDSGYGRNHPDGYGLRAAYGPDSVNREKYEANTPVSRSLCVLKTEIPITHIILLNINININIIDIHGVSKVKLASIPST